MEDAHTRDGSRSMDEDSAEKKPVAITSAAELSGTAIINLICLVWAIFLIIPLACHALSAAGKFTLRMSFVCLLYFFMMKDEIELGVRSSAYCALIVPTITTLKYIIRPAFDGLLELLFWGAYRRVKNVRDASLWLYGWDEAAMDKTLITVTLAVFWVVVRRGRQALATGLSDSDEESGKIHEREGGGIEVVDTEASASLRAEEVMITQVGQPATTDSAQDPSPVAAVDAVNRPYGEEVDGEKEAIDTHPEAF